MSRKTTTTIIVTVLAACLAIGCVFLIVFGIRQHKEGNLLKACWSGGIAHYVGAIEGELASCSNPQDVIWLQKQIPIHVTTKGTLAPWQSDVLRHAVEDLNLRLRFDLFSYSKTDGPIYVFMDSPVNRGFPGRIAHQKNPDGTLVANIFIRSDVAVSDRLLFKVLEHEMLHAAGLAHDPSRFSIMHPLSNDDSLLFGTELQQTIITDNDIRLLSRYKDSGGNH